MSTTNLRITEMTAGQYQKEVTFNDLCWLLDAVLGNGVKSQSSTPPASPSEGDVYVVGASPTGSWAGEADSLAQFVNSSWRFYAPRNGWRVYNQARADYLVFNGSWSVQESVLFGPDSNSFKQVIRVQRDSVEIGAVDNSSSNFRFKALGSSSLCLFNTNNEGMTVLPSNHTVHDTPTSAVSDTDLNNGSMSFYLDEATNKVMIRVKTSSGAYKTAEVPMV